MSQWFIMLYCFLLSKTLRNYIADTEYAAITIFFFFPFLIYMLDLDPPTQRAQRERLASSVSLFILGVFSYCVFPTIAKCIWNLDALDESVQAYCN
mgnify:CR=1 FL=1